MEETDGVPPAVYVEERRGDGAMTVLGDRPTELDSGMWLTDMRSGNTKDGHEDDREGRGLNKEKASLMRKLYMYDLYLRTDDG